MALVSLCFACEHGGKVTNCLIEKGNILEFFFDFIKINDNYELILKILIAINNLLEHGKAPNNYYLFSSKFLQLDFQPRLEALKSQNEEYLGLCNFLIKLSNAYFYKKVDRV